MFRFQYTEYPIVGDALVLYYSLILFWFLSFGKRVVCINMQRWRPWSLGYINNS